MGTEPRIYLQNLNWAYGEKTGAVPYIFNKEKTAVKLYSEEYNYDTLDINRSKTIPSSQQLFYALNKYFDDEFMPISKIAVYEQAFSIVEQEIRRARFGAFEFQPLSQKDINRMQKKYNAYMQRQLEKDAQKAQRQAQKDEIQDSIMDF